jgi:hypothetical protein
LAIEHGLVAGRVFALAAMSLIAWASTSLGLDKAKEHLEVAQQLHAQHKAGPLPLLLSVSNVIDGQGAAGILEDLPALQKHWLAEIIAPSPASSG